MWAVIDTSLYIGHWEEGLYDGALERVRRAFIVLQSAVVLSELRRGTRTRAAERTVAKLHALARDPWTPNQTDSWEAGRLIRTIGDAHDWDHSERRDLQNDALIALSAGRHGATVVMGVYHSDPVRFNEASDARLPWHIRNVDTRSFSFADGIQ